MNRHLPFSGAACGALAFALNAPGATYVPTGDIWVEVLGGTDGEDGWARRTKATEKIQSPSKT